MKKLTATVMSIVLVIGLSPASAGATAPNADESAKSPQATVGQPTADASTTLPSSQKTDAASTDALGAAAAPTTAALQAESADAAIAVEEAAEAALAYASARGLTAPALKDAFEMKLPGALCYSLENGVYHVIVGGGYFTFAVEGGNVASVDAVSQTDQPTVFDTVADAEAAIEGNAESAPAAFATRGLKSAGDGGHGRYVQVDALASGQPGVTVGDTTYALASGESAVNVYQLGYESGEDASVNAAIEAFHASGFHTLVFPQGEYRLSAEVYACHDDRSYYGLDATLFTDGAVEVSARNEGHKSLWVIRGDIGWGKGTETYETTGDDGNPTTKKKDVFYAVRNVELRGVKIERRDGSSGYNRAIAVRSAKNVTIANCEIRGGQYASGNTTSTTGAIIDFYGDYSDISLLDCTVEGEAGIDIRDLCDHVDNISASMQVAKDYPTGGRNVVIRGCDITTHNFDEGLPIFAGNEQGLGYYRDGVFVEYPTLTHCLIDNVTVENNRYTMLKPATDKQRVVSITCGYQDSPVRNVHIANNVFDVYANNYLVLFGWAEDCIFANNDVTLRSTIDAPKIVPVIRAAHSRTGPTKNVRVENNTMRFPDEGASLQRMVDSALGAEAVTFSGNDVTVAGSVERVFDSTAASTGNTFHLNTVKRLYDRVGEVARNTYGIKTLTGLYESYDTNAQVDLDIHDERARIGELTSHLLSFNGTPSYNGHSLTFANCVYDIAAATEKYRRIAYDTAAIADELVLSISNCDIPGFDTAPYMNIQNNEGEKVTFSFTSSRVSRASVAVMRADESLAAGTVVATSSYFGAESEEENEDAGNAGAGVYDIKDASDVTFLNVSEAPDDGRYVALDNGLIAELRLTGENADALDLSQYGVKGDGTDEDIARIRAALHSGAATVHAPDNIDLEAFAQRTHDWGDWRTVTPPTCTEAGSEARTCQLESSHVQTREIAALGHVDDGGKVTKAATADAGGTITHTCTRCGAVISTSAIPKTGPSGDSDGSSSGSSDSPGPSSSGSSGTSDASGPQSSASPDAPSSSTSRPSSGTTSSSAGKSPGSSTSSSASSSSKPTASKPTSAKKKANTITVKGKTVTRKAKTLKKKTLKIARAKAVKVTKARGKVTYKVVKIATKKKLRAQAKKKIKIAKTTGKITLVKGLKKGVYKLKVNVRAAGNSTYKAKTKTATITIKVK